MAGFFKDFFGTGPETPKRPLDQAGADEALALVRSNRKIQAVKLVREHTGMGLAEAKDTVDAIESGQWVPAPGHGISLADQARELLAQDRLAEAVTLVSRTTGMTETEASRFLDALDR